MTMNKGTPLVEMRDISISFGGIKAVDHVSIDLHPGEVVGLLGHNGAGKSTLIKCLSGAYQKDTGEIYVNGERAEINNPRDARNYNIETIYQAGTLSGNPVAMAAGLAMLDLVSAPGFHDALEANSNLLCDGLEAAARDAGVPFTTTRVGGMFGLFFTEQAYVDTYAEAVACDQAAFNRFFHAMRERGVYLAPSAFEAGFMSSAHDADVIEATIAAAREAFAELAA